MFQALGDVELTTAREEAKKRLIWKGNRFHALPASLPSAVLTPLFTWKDKFRILGEPFRSKGNNPDETVAQLAARRLGRSFVDYAVDPFLSGVYAGNPNTLVTRYALPKLYNLEQNYGSFIKGSIAKAKEPKTERDHLATRKVFSAQGGLSTLVEALTHHINSDGSGQNIITGAKEIRIKPGTDGPGTTRWRTEFMHNGELCILQSEYVITTVGSYSLPDMLPFVETEQLNRVNNLFYAPIVQAAVGYSEEALPHFRHSAVWYRPVSNRIFWVFSIRRPASGTEPHKAEARWPSLWEGSDIRITCNEATANWKRWFSETCTACWVFGKTRSCFASSSTHRPSHSTKRIAANGLLP